MKKFWQWCAVAGLVVLMGLCLMPSVVLAQQNVGPVVPSSAVVHKNGSLISMGQAIYLIDRGQKRGFPTLNEFLTYHYHWSRVAPANASDYFLLVGPPMRARAGSIVLDLSDGHTVYLIGSKGEKQGFVSMAALGRYRTAKTIIWPIDVSGYAKGGDIK